jgi:hypothetical protein
MATFKYMTAKKNELLQPVGFHDTRNSALALAVFLFNHLDPKHSVFNDRRF